MPLIPQPDARPPQKQTTYVGVSYQVTPMPGGAALLAFTTGTEAIAFPLDPEAREAIGKALLAPHVVTPNGRPS